MSDKKKITFFTRVAFSFIIMGISVTARSVEPASNFDTRAVPPTPKFQRLFDAEHNREEIVNRINSWTEGDPQNVWELSGLHEGDIMLHPDSQNGLLNPLRRWPGGVVPYYIEEKDFDQDDIKVIEGAIKAYHTHTCLRFRPYEKSDKDYVTIQGKESGCWSSVGRRRHGQVLNLQKSGCVRHGTVIHELMHAVGFYHQQSATDRDEWVIIHWDNIKEGKENNFRKYGKLIITDYGVGYDYNSVMHYSSHAFSKNYEPTITPRNESETIGQRNGFSEKDILKIQEMYKKECGRR